MRLSQLEELVNKYSNKSCCHRLFSFFEHKDPTLDLLKTTLVEIIKSPKSPLTSDSLIDNYYIPFVKRLNKLISPGALSSLTKEDVLEFILKWESDALKTIRNTQNNLQKSSPRPQFVSRLH